MSGIDHRQATARARQQQAIDHPAPFYLQACPGAGKTRVIVERHLRRSLPSGRRGRALVSFTNVARQEIYQRCHDAGLSSLLRFPHFVGTIDAFFWRYLVRPFIPDNRYRTHIDSWDRINATVTVRGSSRRPYTLRLSEFQFQYDVNTGITTSQLSRRTYADFNALQAEGLLAKAEREAVRASKEYAKNGPVTGHEIRVLALYTLRRHRDSVRSMLCGRFEELVVDEAQDCSNLDLEILTHLRDIGLPLVFVCDPDQAIYQFRGAEPDRVRAFGTALGTRIDLTGNWRSSPAICQLAATLRPARYARSPDDPVGPRHADAIGILLIPNGSSDQLDSAIETFTARAHALGIATEQQLVLAHAGSNLPKHLPAASRPPLRPRAARLSWAAAILRDASHTPRQREAAYEIAERALLGYWYHDIDRDTVNAWCERHGLDRSGFRRTASRCLAALPSVDRHSTFGTWCTEANSVLKKHPPAPGLRRQGNSGRLAPGSKLAARTTRTAAGVPVNGQLQAPRVSVIHQVKGEQAEAVLVIVPDDERTRLIMDAWTSGDHPLEVAETCGFSTSPRRAPDGYWPSPYPTTPSPASGRTLRTAASPSPRREPANPGAKSAGGGGRGRPVQDADGRRHGSARMCQRTRLLRVAGPGRRGRRPEHRGGRHVGAGVRHRPARRSRLAGLPRARAQIPGGPWRTRRDAVGHLLLHRQRLTGA